MFTDMTPPGEDAEFVRRAAEGHGDAWRDLVAACHPRLRRVVALRLDARLSGRLDPSDVLQDVYAQAAQELPEYVRQPSVPFFLWLRFLAVDRLARLHRFHLGTQARDADREVSLSHGQSPEVSTTGLAAHLLGPDRTPGEAAARAEQHAILEAALARLDPLDREAIALRHFEQLSSAEAALVLGVTPAAAAKRYFRAVQRLKELLADAPGGLDGFLP